MQKYLKINEFIRIMVSRGGGGVEGERGERRSKREWERILG